MNNQVVDTIQNNIGKGEQNSPFLLLSQNHAECIVELNTIVSNLQNIYGLPSSYIFRFEDNDEKLKVSSSREIVKKGSIRPHYEIQIFIIENISRMTLGFSNSLLKFLEEPGVGNIVFLTNTSESGILDTVLSRVQIITIHSGKNVFLTDGIETMIEKYIERNNTEILGHYFSKTIEKQDALYFLYALIGYIKKSGNCSHLLENINRDLNGLTNNNFLPKYIIDSYLIALR